MSKRAHKGEREDDMITLVKNLTKAEVLAQIDQAIINRTQASALIGLLDLRRDISESMPEQGEINANDLCDMMNLFADRSAEMINDQAQLS
jgi:hypothetical protein